MDFIPIKTAEEALQVRKIWKQVFIDDDRYLDRFFEKCFPFLSTYALVEDREIRSIASLIDLKYADLRLKYLYGVATPVQFRGRKYSQKLTEWLVKSEKSAGTDAILTRPANRNLFDFYRRQGFTCELKRRILSKEIQSKPSGIKFPEAASDFRIGRKNHPQSLDSLYHLCLKEAETSKNITFEQPVLTFAIEDFLEDSGIVFYNNDDYLFTKIDHELVRIESSTTVTLPHFLNESFAHEQIMSVQMFLPEETKLGIPENYGLAYILKEELGKERISDLPPIQFLME